MPPREQAAMNMRAAILLLLATAVLPACGRPGASLDDNEDAATDTSGPGEPSEDAGGDAGVFVGEDPTDFPASCDPFAQDCPRGEKCVPYASGLGGWDRNKCVSVLGDQAASESCVYDGNEAATDNCDATSLCWDVAETDDGELLGTCHLMCQGSFDNPTCPADQECLFGSAGVVGVCEPVCDPVEQDCVEGTSCYWAVEDFLCMAPHRQVPVGDVCGFHKDCQAPAACMASELLPSCASSGCCAPFCDLDATEDPCDLLLAGTSCEPWFVEGTAPAGSEHIGVCLLAP